MKKVTVKQLTLRNFKGAENLIINLQDDENFITGDNGTGKTTIFDAFNFLLWGKNSLNESDFDVKPFNPDHTFKSHLEYSVEGIIDVDGIEVGLQRILKEKWQTRRGEETPEMKGHETDFFINGVPKSLAEYNAYVAEIFPADITRICTDPLYFNAQLKWEQRREILSRMAGEVSDEKIVLTMKHNRDVIKEILASGKSLEDRKKEVAAKRLKLKEQISHIPARIDEVDRSKPNEQNWEVIEKEIQLTEMAIKAQQAIIDQIDSGASKQQEEINKQTQRRIDLSKQIGDLRAELQRDLDKHNQSIANENYAESTKRNRAKTDLQNLESDLAGNSTEIANIRAKNDAMRTEWTELNASKFNTELDTTCPTCKQHLPEGDLNSKREELEQQFNRIRTERMTALSEQATRNNSRIQELQALNSGIEKKILELKEYLETSFEPKQIDESPVTSQELEKRISEINSLPTIETIPVSKEKENAKSRKTELEADIQEIKTKLLDRNKIQEANARIEELKQEQKNLSAEQALLEKTEFAIDQFTASKMDIIEKNVNLLFEGVSFKMFKKLVNGGMDPTCVCVVDGKPFRAMNKALQIQTGLQIIKTIQKYFGVNFPVWIDNRESVTEIPYMGCQVINLVKVAGQKELIVN